MNKESNVAVLEPSTGDMQQVMHPMVGVAMSKGDLSADNLSALLQVQKDWEANEARKRFSEAMAYFQSNLPEITKTKSGHNCKYADIDDIAQAIKSVLQTSGLSYRFEQSQSEQGVTVTCIVTHVAGHQESATLTAANDTSGGKNAIQAIASAVTYLRRYTLTGLLGITTGMEDDDGGKPAVDLSALLYHNKIASENFASIYAIKKGIEDKDYSTAKEALSELDEQTQHTLWRAPTKGGLFTTVEVKTMKTSNEWSAA